MSHPIKDVYNRSNVIFALSWFLLAQALNSGAAHIPEESTLLAWLDTPVDPTNPDDIIQITRLNEPIFVRVAPRGDGLDLSGPFTSSGAHRMIKQPLRKTGMLRKFDCWIFPTSSGAVESKQRRRLVGHRHLQADITFKSPLLRCG